MALKDLLVSSGDWSPPRIIIYGDEKSGKTSTAAQAPKPLFLGTDDGRRRLKGVAGLGIPKSWDEFIEQLEITKAEAVEDGYKSIVIDTLNGVVDLCAEHVCETQFNGSWNSPKDGFLAWGGHRGWSAVSEVFKGVLPIFDSFVDQGLWVIMLAHTEIQKVRNPLGEDFDRLTPAIDKRVWSRIGRWADVIMRVEEQKTLIERDGRIKAVSDGTRVLKCSATSAEVAGCRVGYELPAEIPFAWESIEEHLGQPDNTTLTTLREMLKPIKGEKLKKIFNYLGIKSIDELDSVQLHKAKATINRLKEATR